MRSRLLFVLCAITAANAPAVARAQSAPPPAAPASGTAAPAAGAAGDAAKAPGAVDPSIEEGDDMSMTFHAARPADMQEFAQANLQEIQVGKLKPRYALNFFGDLSLGASSKTEGITKPDPAFATGVYDILFNAELDSKVLATSEVTFQYEPSAPLAELERLHLRWKPSKAFFFEVGRFHTDIGYWNVAYHHGKWLQLPIERPRTILLHGGLLPVHWVGAQTGVSIPVGGGSINFVTSVGSARDPIGVGGHQTHSAAFTPVNGVHAKLEAAGIGIRDLHIGVSGIYDRIPAEEAIVRPGLPDTGIDEYIGNAFIAFPSVPFTAIAEGYIIQHQVTKGDLSSGEAGSKWRSYSVFALLGYTLGIVTPYVKGEYISSRQGSDIPDAFYIPEPRASVPTPPSVALDLVEGTGGIRFDVNTWSSVKVEYRATGGYAQRIPGTKDLIHTGTANWSFGL